MFDEVVVQALCWRCKNKKRHWHSQIPEMRPSDGRAMHRCALYRQNHPPKPQHSFSGSCDIYSNFRHSSGNTVETCRPWQHPRGRSDIPSSFSHQLLAVVASQHTENQRMTSAMEGVVVIISKGSTPASRSRSRASPYNHIVSHLWSAGDVFSTAFDVAS